MPSGNAGTVYRRSSDGKWCASLQINGKRKTVYAKTEREAKRKLAELQRAIGSDNTLPDPGRKTVNDLLGLWLETASHSLRAGTIADYQDICDRHIRPRLGRIKLRDLNPAHLQMLYNDLSAKGRKRIPSFVHSLLHRALKMAVLWGWLVSNPADRVLVPRSKSERKSLWSPEELRAFLKASREHRLGPLWLVTAASGCRIGELMALHWSDVDLINGTITIRGSLRKVKGEWLENAPKTESGFRTIALPPEGVDALKRQQEQQIEWHGKAGDAWQDNELIFTTIQGEPLGRSMIEHALTRQCKKLGIREISPHQLRHLHATLLLGNNLPITAVSARLGHADANITMSIYAHAIKKQDEEIARMMSRMLRECSTQQ